MIGDAASLRGTLDAGGQITATGLRGFHAEGSANSTTRIVLRATTITVEADGPPAATIRYALTNFFFHGTRHLDGNCVLPLVLPSVDRKVAEVTIVPVANYSDIEDAIGWVGGGIAVTCHASIGLRAAADVPTSRRLIDDLCFMLSLARGTKIQWIEEALVAGDGSEVRTAHEDHVTKPFTPLSVIDPRRAHAGDTRDFIEGTFPRYLETRDSYLLDRGIIDLYLDARAEGDFLEVRGVKVVVAIEAVKDVFLRHPSCPMTEFILPESNYGEMREDIKKAVGGVLKGREVCKDQRGLIYKNLSALNRTPFKDVVRGLLSAIDLPIEESDLDRLVASRNQLIHTGRFPAALALEEPAEGRAASSVTEYFELLAFLDRCLLRLLGYDGPWIDMSRAPESRRRQTVR